MSVQMTKRLDLVMLLAGCFILWQVLHLIAGEGTLASPVATFETLFSLLSRGTFWIHVQATCQALAIAMAISTILGVPLGIAFGFNRFSGLVVEPILISFFSLPKVTLYPLVLLVFGLGISAKVAFGAMHALIPVTLLTMNAVRQMRPVLLKTAKVMQLSAGQLAGHVIAPSIMPSLLSALQLGFSLSLLGVLIGEMFAAKAGLGFLMMNAIALNDTKTLLAIITLLFTFVIVVNESLRYLGRSSAGRA
jgi:NitT/TauT family transport system permease protein